MLNHRSLLLGLTALLGLGMLTGDTRAYQVEVAPWSELVAKSERAVHGHVIASWGAWAPDQSGRVITRHEILVWNERQVTGPSDSGRVLVTLPGGQIGNRRTVVPGLAPLNVGDEVLLLLTHTPWGWQPIGYELGMVRLNTPAATEAAELQVLLDETLGQNRVAP